MPDPTLLLHLAFVDLICVISGAGLRLSYDHPRTTSSSKMQQQQQQTARHQQQQMQLVNSSNKQQPAAAAAQPQEPAAQRWLAAAAAVSAGSCPLSWMQDKTRTQPSTEQQYASSHASGMNIENGLQFGSVFPFL
jgi:hypothetical protein